MSDMNSRLEALLKQMREMRLTPAELDRTIDKYEGDQSVAGVLIYTAATMLHKEVTF